MRIIYIVIVLFCLFSKVLFSQHSFIGVPLLDKKIQLGNCPVCLQLSNDSNLSLFYDSLLVSKPLYYDDDEAYYLENFAYWRALLKKHEANTNKFNVILHHLINFSSESKIEEHDECDLDDVLEFSSLIDTIILRNPAPEFALYFHKRRMYEFYYSGVWSHIEDDIYEFDADELEFFDYDYSKTLRDNKLYSSWNRMASTYNNDFVYSKGYYPYPAYSGLSFGYIGFGARNTYYQGVDFSYDYTSGFNPLEPSLRLSYLGVSYLRELRGNNSDFLLYALQLRSLLQFNPVQFGLNINQSKDIKNFFWRPELGISFGLLNISYAYTLPFKKEVDIKGHQLKFSISFPLIRLGKYKQQ